MKRLALLAMMTMVLFSVAFCSDSAQVAEDKAEGETTEKEEVKEPEILTKESGVRYQELVMGEGAEAVDGTHLTCHYTLWLADSTGLVKGDKVDSSHDRNQPFECTLGQRLIPGWSDGMTGMKEGGARRIFVPWKLGYPNGAGARIPPQTNLIFEIEFLKKL